MTISAAEQYMLELINRARLDPTAEALRYGLTLNAGLPAGTIDAQARQVLAPNETLGTAAEDHSRWMLTENVFSHTGTGSSTPGDRMQAAGYEFTGAWSWRENLAWSGTTGTIDLEAAIEGHHEGLYRSAGHRANTFAADSKEIGIGQLQGDFTSGGRTYDTSMVTLKFAASGPEVFVTGVAFTDLDGDDFYSIGEGRSGVWVRADGKTETTASAGGYGVEVTASNSVLVEMGQGADVLASVRMDLSQGNGKLDLMTNADGSQVMLLSTNATLVSGIPDATLLGIGNLSLTGNDMNNVLTGNSGNNHLSGEGGDDQLFGGGVRTVKIGGTGANADVLTGGVGDDRLFGQAGADRLDGGAGDDILTGGGGRDTFVFASGRDVVTDFTDNVDLVEIDTDHTLTEVLDMGQIIDGDAVFDFGSGDVLILRDVSDISSLENDLLIV